MMVAGCGVSLDKPNVTIGDPFLMVKDVCAKMIESREALRILSLTVNRGEIVGSRVSGNDRSVVRGHVGVRQSIPGVLLAGKDITRSLLRKSLPWVWLQWGWHPSPRIA
jgi:ABC-type uncharacterized transport system ATPase subunit